MGKKRLVVDVDEDGWEPRYGNDSRSWLLGFSENAALASSTTTKEAFTADQPPELPTEGVRRQQLRKALWDETRKEVVKELSQVEEAPPSNTEYNTSFVKEGFISCPIKADPELHRRYPLYGEGGLSLWRERFPQLPGATRAPHTTHLFHRSAAFTKPIDQVFDTTAELR